MNQTHLTHPDKQAKMVFAKRFVFAMFTLPNISKKSSSPVIFQEKKLEIVNFFDNIDCQFKMNNINCQLKMVT